MSDKQLTGKIERRRIRSMQVPRERAAEMLALARAKAAAEETKCAAIDRGMSVADLPKNA